MPDHDDHKKRSPLKSLPPDGFPIKTGLIWIAIIGAIVALFMLNPKLKSLLKKVRLMLKRRVIWSLSGRKSAICADTLEK